MWERLRRFPFPLTLSLICIVLQCFEPWSSTWFAYRAESVLHGQWWRILSGNAVHLGFSHLFLNLSALWFGYFLFPVLRLRKLGPASFLASALGVGLGLLLFSKGIDWYVGLSGALHGMFVAAVVTQFSERRIESSIVLAAIIAKIAYEQLAGSLPGSAWISQGDVIVDAHLYGAVTGLAIGLIYRAMTRPPPEPRQGATRY